MLQAAAQAFALVPLCSTAWILLACLIAVVGAFGASRRWLADWVAPSRRSIGAATLERRARSRRSSSQRRHGASSRQSWPLAMCLIIAGVGSCAAYQLVPAPTRGPQPPAAPNSYSEQPVDAVCVYNASRQLVRVLPKFFIIGAAKSATSSLFEDIMHHPCVLSPRAKELRSWLLWPRAWNEPGLVPGSRYTDAPLSARLASDYRSLQNWCAAGASSSTQCSVRISGEATPDYAFYPAAALRIALHVPAARLVLLVRDPVERAASALLYHHPSLRTLLLRNRSAVVGAMLTHIAQDEEQVQRCAVVFDEIGRIDTSLACDTRQHEAESNPACRAQMRAFARQRLHLYEHNDTLLGQSTDRCFFPPRCSHLNTVARAQYSASIRLYSRIFPPRSLAVVEAETLRAQPNQTVGSVAQFIGLPPYVLSRVAWCNGPCRPGSRYAAHRTSALVVDRLSDIETSALRARAAPSFREAVQQLCELTTELSKQKSPHLSSRSAAAIVLLPNQPLCYHNY